jgi:hypothetical protein
MPRCILIGLCISLRTTYFIDDVALWGMFFFRGSCDHHFSRTLDSFRFVCSLLLLAPYHVATQVFPFGPYRYSLFCHSKSLRVFPTMIQIYKPRYLRGQKSFVLVGYGYMIVFY